jgi:predicted dehydrogenase
MEKKGIAVIGAGMIGAAHASGYRAQLPRFLKREPGLHLSTVCDANQEAAQALAASYGFPRVTLRWQEVVAEDSIRILSVALPNFLHEEVTYAALSAGKHVICEKPLALTAAGARILCAKAAEAGVTAAAVFNYRRFPAVAGIKKLVDQGLIGDPVQIVSCRRNPYAADPQLLRTAGATRENWQAAARCHDVGTDAIDLAMFLCGELEEILGAVETTVIRSRFLPVAATTGHGHAELGAEQRSVDTDDLSSAVLRFKSGCLGLFSASRVAVGMGNTLSFFLAGTLGSVRFSTERRTSISWPDGTARVLLPFRPCATAPPPRTHPSTCRFPMMGWPSGTRKPSAS